MKANVCESEKSEDPEIIHAECVPLYAVARKVKRFLVHKLKWTRVLCLLACPVARI